MKTFIEQLNYYKLIQLHTTAVLIYLLNKIYFKVHYSLCYNDSVTYSYSMYMWNRINIKNTDEKQQYLYFKTIQNII